MPTYQYRCTECGEPLEAVQAFTDDPLTECPACGGRLRKVFSAVGVVFKGSGFYRTDSRSGTSAASADKGERGSGDKGSGDKGSGDKGTEKSSEKSAPSKEPAAAGSSSGSSSGGSSGSSSTGTSAAS